MGENEEESKLQESDLARNIYHFPPPSGTVLGLKGPFKHLASCSKENLGKASFASCSVPHTQGINGKTVLLYC